MLLPAVLFIASCAPTFTWNMPGGSLEQWHADLQACIDAEHGVPSNAAQAQNVAAATNAGSNATPTAGVAAAGAAGFVAGIAQAEAQRAARERCFENRGYMQVLLTEAQKKAAVSMTREQRKAFADRLAISTDVTTEAP